MAFPERKEPPISTGPDFTGLAEHQPFFSTSIYFPLTLIPHFSLGTSDVATWRIWRINSDRNAEYADLISNQKKRPAFTGGAGKRRLSRTLI